MQNKIIIDEQISEPQGMFLNKKEIAELTGRKRVDAQIKELHKLEITFRLRSGGSIAVLREHVQKEFGGKTEMKKNTKPFKFKWDVAHA